MAASANDGDHEMAYDARYIAALTEVLVALPPLPPHWPAGTVQNAVRKALAAADAVSRSQTPILDRLYGNGETRPSVTPDMAAGRDPGLDSRRPFLLCSQSQQEDKMSGSMITLADLVGTISFLEVACNRCERRGRLSVDRLIHEHGAAMALPSLCATLAADCPRRRAPSIYNQCGVHYPQLPALFRGPAGGWP